MAPLGKFEILPPSFRYSEIFRFSVNNCAIAFFDARLAVNSNYDSIMMGFQNDIACYFVLDQNLFYFVQMIHHMHAIGNNGQL